MDYKISNTHLQISSVQQKFKAAIFGQGKISSHIPSLFKNLAKDFIDLGHSSNAKNNVYDDIKYIILAVPDHQIEIVYNEVKDSFPSGSYFIHMSGALYLEGLIGLHPLMTFSANNPLKNYDEIPICCDQESFYSDFKDSIPQLKYLPPEKKAIYHAMASMLGNFTQYYLYTMKNNFPEGLNFKIYEQLVLASVKSMFQDGEFKKLTGPFIRGDIETIEKHKATLTEDNQKLLEIYQNFENLFFEEIKL